MGKKGWITGVALLAVAAIAGFWLISKKSMGKEMGGQKQMEAVVSTGTIKTGVSGTGTIAYAEEEEITLPADLTIDKILVSEGSSVTKGTLLATVDEASLALCLSEIEEAIGESDSTIAAELSSSAKQSIQAGIAGRVKKIYADEGDDIARVMQEQGALMLLSVDGLMAVKLDRAGSLSTGEEVTVKSGDTETEGIVESVDTEEMVITFDDDLFDDGEEVTVVSESGTVCGNGEAYIHQAIPVVGSSGTVSSLHVSLNSTVNSTAKLYTLDDSARSAEYLQAVAERERLVALLDSLISIQADGGITAPVDGMLETIGITASSVSVSGGKEIAAEELSAGNGGLSLTATSEKSAGFMTLASVETVQPQNSQDSEKKTARMPEGLKGGAGEIIGTTSDMEYAETEDAQTWIPCTDGRTQVAEGIWYVRYRKTDGEAAGMAIMVKVTKEAAREQDSVDKQEQKEENEEQKTEEQKIGEKKTTEEAGTTENQETGEEQTAAAPSSLTGGGNAQVMAAGSGTGKTEAGDNTQASSVETVSAFSIANGDKMTVTMNVDELDIGSMKVGLSAEITLDAAEGETFVGEITRVSGNASGGNGVAQYPVEVTFGKTEDMLSGMNASVTVIIEQAENVLTIPLAAVTDKGDKAYVYTGYDEATGELTGETEITLGLSDANNVEVVSGLTMGDTIYYRIADSQENNGDSGNRMNNFENNGMGGMPGDMPGDIPGGSGMEFKGGGGPGNGAMPGGGMQ
ncbi:MAG: HlyD family efflux transporter periplasmic adaptor subunit [Bacteroidales bacterium]|nr:HlyD family efflux transporter periplasmic adaptor subunit [Clostridium sp.]MCM1203241.1 HlyD family efflux transporter periplasmic adaptor subunit [Bacteroidales bacterium]